MSSDMELTAPFAKSNLQSGIGGEGGKEGSDGGGEGGGEGGGDGGGGDGGGGMGGGEGGGEGGGDGGGEGGALFRKGDPALQALSASPGKKPAGQSPRNRLSNRAMKRCPVACVCRSTKREKSPRHWGVSRGVSSALSQSFVVWLGWQRAAHGTVSMRARGRLWHGPLCGRRDGRQSLRARLR